ncbi:MAG TPA: response regulator [Ktedonobacteraceae bacterium]|nr:response regulator [Ktedonobacteraceae bacterium]
MASQHVYNLMIAEDEEVERQAIQLLVERQLPRIRLVGAAATTSELLVRLNLARPHLVILDSHLPGERLVNTLNLLLSPNAALKVIIFADYDEESLMRQCLRFGAFAYLARPVQPQRLLNVLKRAIVVLDNTV